MLVDAVSETLTSRSLDSPCSERTASAIIQIDGRETQAGSFAGLERANLFDVLRFLAATIVIYSHCFPLSGRGDDLFASVSGLTAGTFGVSLFFVLSGFLITRSYLNTSSIVSYTQARCLRILPGLAFSLIVTAFVIGPLCTSFELRQYLSSPLTFDFLANVFLFPIHYQLPGVFVGNPLSGAVNGSLWSLPVEFLMYGAVLVLGVLGILRSPLLVVCVTMVVVALDCVFFSRPQFAHRVELTVLVGPAVNMAVYFLLGGCFYLYREKIPRDWRLAVSAALIWWFSFKSPQMRMAGYCTLPYLFFYCAALPIKPLRRFARVGDFSYGLYVYAFPVQQAMVQFLGAAQPIERLFGASFVVTLLLAVLSWHIVESPAMKLKSKFRRRPETVK